MERIRINYDGLRQRDGFGYSFEGVNLTKKNLTDILDYNRVPTTLMTVDQRFGTHTTADVLQSLEDKTIDAMVEGDRVQILNPKADWISDEQFESILGRYGLEDSKISGSTFGKTATLVLPANDKDNFLGDVFNREIKVDRLPEGGVHFNLGLTRLACTNGMRVKESDYNYKCRLLAAMSGEVERIIGAAKEFNLDEYFRSMFMKDGKWLPLSVADFLEMKKVLTSLTNEDIANMYYSTEQIDNTYMAQGIDITKIGQKYLNKLPSGITYYQGFNILTNAAKQIEEPTLQDQITVASFLKPSKLESMKATELNYDKVPMYSDYYIHSLMGDHQYVVA